MTIFNQTSTNTTVFLTADDLLFLAEDQTILTTSAPAISASSSTYDNIQMFLYGDVIALYDPQSEVNGRAINIGGDGVEVLVGENSQILATGDEGAGVQGSNAIDVGGDDLTLTNYGEITGREHAFDISFSVGTDITNFGTINSLTSNAIDAVFADDTRIVNHGIISGFRGINSSSSSGTEVVNHGTIIGIGSAGVNLSSSLGESNMLVNYGSITGATTGLAAGSGNDMITNRGDINGVSLGSGDDEMINTGTIDGDLSLSDGADVLRGFGGMVTGEIDTGTGNDTIYVDQADAAIDGGADFDVLFARSDVLNAINVEEIYLRGAGDFTALGDSATTLMIGNGGSNSLIGGANAAIMLGGAGDDVVEGAAGDDTLRGNGGNDELLGDEDADRLFGGTGDDTLTGGAGQDNLRGDQGADVFVYNATSESVAGNDRDIIIGFERGTDLIDLSGIGQDAFTFVGTSGFSGGGGLELGYRVVGGGTQVIVEMDENGDGITDAEIRVRGVGELDAGDFVL